MLYHSQNGENRGAFSDKNLKSIANTVTGLDSAALGACLDSGKYKDRVQQELMVGKAAGVTGTPSFLINGQLIVGAQPFAVFDQAIQQALTAAGVAR
jgi:predicted DsbA family dithiol-disulfide isomerase